MHVYVLTILIDCAHHQAPVHAELKLGLMPKNKPHSGHDHNCPGAARNTALKPSPRHIISLVQAKYPDAPFAFLSSSAAERTAVPAAKTEILVRSFSLFASYGRTARLALSLSSDTADMTRRSLFPAMAGAKAIDITHVMRSGSEVLFLRIFRLGRYRSSYTSRRRAVR